MRQLVHGACSRRQRSEHSFDSLDPTALLFARTRVTKTTMVRWKVHRHAILASLRAATSAPAIAGPLQRPPSSTQRMQRMRREQHLHSKNCERPHPMGVVEGDRRQLGAVARPLWRATRLSLEQLSP